VWQSINRALTETLWNNYRISQYDQPDFDDWGELNLSFHGTADFYIDRKDAPARPRTASAATASSNKRSENSGASAPPSGKRVPFSGKPDTLMVIVLLFIVLIIGGLVFGGGR
jgi:hypothetical protein